MLAESGRNSNLAISAKRVKLNIAALYRVSLVLTAAIRFGKHLHEVQETIKH